jgi:hypothetical protein
MFKRFGAQTVCGIDGIPVEGTVLHTNEYQMRDLSKAFDLERVYDIVINVEVAEHLNEHGSRTMIECLAKHAGKLIVFSAAEPGQPGNGHINCQPISYWLEYWADLGWIPDLFDSLAVRCLATMSWFRRNLVVLQRDGRGDGARAITTLTKIGNRQSQWYPQSPGVRNFPFMEPFPEPPDGYKC